MSENVMSASTETTESTQSIETSQPTTAIPADSMSFIDQQLRDNPSIKEFKSVNDLAKSYVHAKQMIGSSIRIPTEDAGDDQRNEFYKRLETVPGVMRFDPDKPDAVYDKLGRPSKPEEYGVNYPENLAADATVKTSFLNTAHQLGLNTKQTQALLDFQSSYVENQNKEMSSKVAAYHSQLKQQFGADFDNRVRAANEAVKIWGAKYPELNTLMSNPLVANNPALVSIFAELGKQAVEGKLPGVQSNISFGLTPGEAQDKIDEMRSNRQHPMHDPKSPGHEAALEKLTKLYEIAHGKHGE